jgi:hypothetical protein
MSPPRLREQRQRAALAAAVGVRRLPLLHSLSDLRRLSFNSGSRSFLSAATILLRGRCGGRTPNINGAAHSIAGIVNASGNVLGMMPHRENHVEDVMGCTDGRGLFAGLVAHLQRAA